MTTANKTLVFRSFLVAALMGSALFGISTADAQTATVGTCTSATLNGSVAPNGLPTNVWFEWGTTQSLGTATQVQTFSANSNFNQLVSGLTPSTTYFFRAVAQNSAGTNQGQILSFSTPACSGTGGNNAAPTITTNVANVLSQSAATLNATVNGNGQNVNVWFEWGTTQSLGNTTTQMSMGPGTANVNFTISGLSANTTYFYRAVAQNSAGTSQGAILSFTTQGTGSGSSGSVPTATTNAANVFSQNSATLNGFVSGNGQTTNAWFEWGTTQSLGNTTSQTFVGTGSMSVTQTLSNLAANTTYFYRVVAQNASGLTQGNIQSFSTFTTNCQFGNCNNQGQNQPFVTTFSANGVGDTFAVLNGSLITNGQIVTRWFEWGTAQGFLSNSTVKLSQSFDGTFTQTVTGLQPNTTYYFRAVGQGSFGPVYGNILTFTTTGFNTNTNTGTNALQVITTLATNVGQSSARLNGLALINQSAVTQAYFEWGNTTALGNATDSQNIGSAPSTSFFASLFGLQSGRTYYYRAVAINSQGGTVRGEIQSFTTSSGTFSTPPSSTTTTVVGTGTGKPALVALTIDRNGACNYRGQTIEYVVTYKNTSNKNLKDVALRVLLPEELAFGSSTFGTYSTADRNVVVALGSLASGQEGSVRVSATVARGAVLGKTSVVTAHLVDTDAATGAQEEVVAYSLNNVCDGGISQGAASFFGGASFLPDSLIEWLLLILVILALVILARNVYGNRQQA